MEHTKSETYTEVGHTGWNTLGGIQVEWGIEVGLSRSWILMWDIYRVEYTKWLAHEVGQDVIHTK